MSDRSMAQFLEKSSSHRCQRFYMLYLGACTLLLYYVKGQVELSPSVVALVCEAGDQLELACNSSSSPLHTWQFTAISERGAAMTYDSAIQSTGPSGVVNPQPLTINSTTIFTFSRLSNSNDLPLISRVTINNVSKGLNGVEINCTDARMVNSATTTIHIIGDVQTSELNIQLLSERLFSDRVTAVLKWTLSSSLTQYSQLLQNMSVSIVPDSGVEMLLLGNASVQLTLLYNTLYNVSIVQSATCEQLSQKAFIELKYSKCSDPLTLVNTSVVVKDYEDPALEGENIIFSCPSGLMMIGPNSAMCIGNGEWEPDPREVNCIGTPTSVSDIETDPVRGGSPSLGIVVGVPVATVAVILIITVIVSILLYVLIRKGQCKCHTTPPRHVDTRENEHIYNQLQRPDLKVQAEEFLMVVRKEETQNSNYSEVQTIPLQRLPRDDTCNVDYAKLVNQDQVPLQKDNCPPVNLDNLLIQLRPQVGPAKWYQFGVAAGIEKETIEKFAEQCSPQDCIVEMLDYWLKNCEGIPTWKDVAEVLKAIGLAELGLSIERVYITGKLPIVVDMNYIPKLDNEEVNELPPPLPPRELSPSLLESPPPVLPPKPEKQVA